MGGLLTRQNNRILNNGSFIKKNYKVSDLKTGQTLYLYLQKAVIHCQMANEQIQRY